MIIRANPNAVIPDFTPVPRKYRVDGWTAERQRGFIAALAETGCVSAAARRINMSPEGAYYLRRQPGADEFRAAWNAALDHGVTRLADIAMERAIEGVAVPVFWRGEQVGEKRWYNDRLLMFILRHRLPGRYGPLKPLPPGTKAEDTLTREAAEALGNMETLFAADEELARAFTEVHYLLVRKGHIPQCDAALDCLCQHAFDEESLDDRRWRESEVEFQAFLARPRGDG